MPLHGIGEACAQVSLEPSVGTAPLTTRITEPHGIVALCVAWSLAMGGSALAKMAHGRMEGAGHGEGVHIV